MSATLAIAQSSTSTRPAVIEVRDAVKRFGAVTALKGVDLTLYEGEVLALLGDNGAGKSTLVKCLSGVHQLDSGSIRLDGKPISFSNAHEARRHGVETVYQDLALFDNLNVAANFFAGRETTTPKALRAFGFLRDRTMLADVRTRLEHLGVVIPDMSRSLGLMSGGQRQGVAVARAAAFASRVVILDEPTAALGLREAGNVLRVITRLKEEGVSIILISHNLEHVMQVADRAVVFLQGRLVGEAVPTAENHERLVSMIVGSNVDAASSRYAINGQRDTNS